MSRLPATQPRRYVQPSQPSAGLRRPSCWPVHHPGRTQGPICRGRRAVDRAGSRRWCGQVRRVVRFACRGRSCPAGSVLPGWLVTHAERHFVPCQLAPDSSSTHCARSISPRSSTAWTARCWHARRPLTRVLAETDHPFGDRRTRGERRPGLVARVEPGLARVHGTSPQVIRLQVWQNLRTLSAETSVGSLLPSAIPRHLAAV